MSGKRVLANKFWVELVIQDKFREKVPFLHFDSDGRQLFSLCCEDFWSYLAFLETNFPAIKNNTANRTSLGRPSEAVTEEVTEIISVFVGLWKKKFCQRVKFVEKLPTNDQMGEMRASAGQRATGRELAGLIEKTKEALVRNGEICGTTILAETLVRKCLSESRPGTANQTIQNRLVEEAKQLARVSGNLLFMHLKKY
jgi:hypothetical protein